MTSSRFLLAAALLGALGAVRPAFAAGAFECPTRPLEQPAAIKALLPVGNALDDPAALNAAIGAMRAMKASQGVIIDSLIAAYCPVVAGNAALSDAQKATRVVRYASKIARTVYAVDGADQIILDVALPPSVVNAIGAKASAAGITPEAFVAGAVAAALD